MARNGMTKLPKRLISVPPRRTQIGGGRVRSWSRKVVILTLSVSEGEGSHDAQPHLETVEQNARTPHPAYGHPLPACAGRGALERAHGECPSPLRERGRRCREAADEGAVYA